MSATELIKQVAALPQRERALFEDIFRAMKNTNGALYPAGRLSWPDFEKRLDAIYGDKIVPDSQSVIDERTPKPAKRRGAVGLAAQFARCPKPIRPPARHIFPF